MSDCPSERTTPKRKHEPEENESYIKKMKVKIEEPSITTLATQNIISNEIIPIDPDDLINSYFKPIKGNTTLCILFIHVGGMIGKLTSINVVKGLIKFGFPLICLSDIKNISMMNNRWTKHGYSTSFDLCSKLNYDDICKFINDPFYIEKSEQINRNCEGEHYSYLYHEIQPRGMVLAGFLFHIYEIYKKSFPEKQMFFAIKYILVRQSSNESSQIGLLDLVRNHKNMVAEALTFASRKGKPELIWILKQVAPHEKW